MGPDYYGVPKWQYLVLYHDSVLKYKDVLQLITITKIQPALTFGDSGGNPFDAFLVTMLSLTPPPSPHSPPRCFVFGTAASGIGTTAIGGQEGAGGDKAGTGMLLGRKRARLMPAGCLEKVTPEAGEGWGVGASTALAQR